MYTTFIDYCLDFYGPKGIYKMKFTTEEIVAALIQRTHDFKDLEFIGDSTDRELIRDIVLKNRSSTADEA